jgi:hypothetical protein
MTGKIFINYRHDDSGDTAGRLYDRLEQTFGPESLFIDSDISPGDDFEKDLHDQLNASFVFLAVIGPNWLLVSDKDGQCRLADPDDWVRVEIATALARGINVIPVIINDTLMPDASQLPSNLKDLAKRQNIRLRHRQFDQDFAVLEHMLRETLGVSPLVLVVKTNKFREFLRGLLKTERRPGWKLVLVVACAGLGLLASIAQVSTGYPGRLVAETTAKGLQALKSPEVLKLLEKVPDARKALQEMKFRPVVVP